MEPSDLTLEDVADFFDGDELDWAGPIRAIAAKHVETLNRLGDAEAAIERASAHLVGVGIPADVELGEAVERLVTNWRTAILWPGRVAAPVVAVSVDGVVAIESAPGDGGVAWVDLLLASGVHRIGAAVSHRPPMLCRLWYDEPFRDGDRMKPDTKAAAKIVLWLVVDVVADAILLSWLFEMINGYTSAVPAFSVLDCVFAILVLDTVLKGPKHRNNYIARKSG